MTTPPVKSTNELALERNAYALTRTTMGADRTLMAWIRTALSLYSFGFTIYKLLQDFVHSGATLAVRTGEPRTVGLVMTGMGAVTMLMGVLEYWLRMRELEPGRPFPVLRRPVFVMSLVMSAIGIFLFAGILFKAL
jgi:putative membrane protein